jgi:sugar (pentulose or hexulose) kinase
MALELYPHAEAGLWVLGGSITSAGAALAWAADVLGYEDVTGVFHEGFDIHPKDTSNLLIFVPHLAGERCPNWNSQVRGLWAGLSITHSRADLMRAAFNGTAYALNGILRRIDAVIGRQEQVVVAHRLGDSMEWLQFRTNVYGRPVGVLNTCEPTALGAMLLGATGIGVYPNLREAVNNVAGITHMVEPDADSQSLLARESALYEQVQTAMLPIWQAMHTSLEALDGGSVRSLET